MNKTRLFLILIFVTALNHLLFSQTQDLGNPVSWNGKLATATTPIVLMPAFDRQLITAEDNVNDSLKDKPWRFGYKYDVNLTPKNSGLWTTLPNGDKVWRLSIICQDALTVNLILENYNLPKGAFLYLYDIDKTNRVGAYTEINNQKNGELGTELVHGQHIVIEYYEPSYIEKRGSFKISNVIHGYRSISQIQDTFIRALNSSGDCNIDVNCPLGNGWDNEIRSVAMIVVGGSGICTGALVNNTCNDGTLYFLTANHCLGGSTGTWAFRFNWQSPVGTQSCATTTGSVDPGPPYDQTANGATTLVSAAASDFALLELTNMTLSDAQNWNCFYAGWDASDLTTVTQATCIHHPSGDVKKICRENDAPFHSNNGGAATWYINQWEEGVTEPGSSGSPLFDQNHRIIGQLYGGLAACSGTVNNNQHDYYGRIGVSWNNGLDNYLSPSACGGSSLTNDGWDPNTPTLPDDAGISGIASPVGPYCVDNFDPEITLRNYGTNHLTSVTIDYNIDGGTNISYPWTGNLSPGGSQTITFPNLTTVSGSHTFNVMTSLPNGNVDSNPLNDVGNSNFSATIGGQDILLEINTDCWGSEITWTIEDSNANILASGGPYNDISGGELITENICLASACYDFIINDTYGDGMYGSQWGSCSVDGNYAITDLASGTVLASTIAPNADFGNKEINNFCVTQPCSWSLTYSTIQDTCYGNNNGQITVNPNNGTGLYSFDIGSGPQSSPIFTNLSQGNYTIYVSDSNCTSSVQAFLNGPDLIQGAFTYTDISCNELQDGSISVLGSGGNGNYTYDFGSGFVSSGFLSGLGAGTYSVTIQDGTGCFGTATATLNQPLAINVFSYVVDETVASDGEINITVSGGVPPYTYSWTGPLGYTSTNEDIGGLISGNYTLTVIDDNGCIKTETIIVNSFVGSQNFIDQNFKIYPNPSSGIFNIDCGQNQKNNFKIYVFDLTGRLILQQESKNIYKSKIDISEKLPGTYFVKLFLDENKYQFRIVHTK